MKTIQIKGKPYVMVNERIKEFRENYKDYSLITEIVSLSDNSCVMKASVINADGVVVATGFAQEDKQSSAINKTSFIENCETSAWGRALGNLGIGIDESIASAEEVNIAIAKQFNNTENQAVKSEEKKQSTNYTTNSNNEQISTIDIEKNVYRFKSGKHKDCTIEEVAKNDREYLESLLQVNDLNAKLKEMIEEALNG